MTKTALTSLEEVLLNCGSMLWSDALFGEEVEQFLPSAPCLVHDPNDVVDETDPAPEVAMKLGFSYLLDIATIQSICSNMRRQKPDASVDDLCAAFNFYMTHDAFIEV